MNKFFKLFSGLLCLPLIGGIMMNSTTRDVVRADATTGTATVSFGNNNVKIDGTSISFDDNLGGKWTCATKGTTSFTQQPTYSQIGKAKAPATSIVLEGTLPSNYNVTELSSNWGGFSGTAGTVTMKVGDTKVGTGSLSGTKDVTVLSTKAAEGNKITISVSGIAKGVKLYNISYTCVEAGTSASSVTGVTVVLNDIIDAKNNESVTADVEYDVTYDGLEGDKTISVKITDADGKEKDFATSEPASGSFTIDFTENGTFIVTVTSTEDPSKSASGTITVTNIREVATPQYVLTTSIADGDYIIASSGYTYVMGNSLSSSRINNVTSHTVSNNVIKTRDLSIVWKITKDGDSYTIQNKGNNQYLAATSSAGKAALVKSVENNYARWNISYDIDSFVFENVARISATTDSDKRFLRNNEANGWAAYSSLTGSGPRLFAYMEEGRTLTDFAITKQGRTSYREGSTLTAYGFVFTATYSANPTSYIFQNITDKNLQGLTFEPALGTTLSTIGTTSVKVSYKYGEVTKSVSFNVTVDEVVIGTYEKVTSELVDYRGTYIAVYEGAKGAAKVLNGSLDTIDVVNNGIDTTITNDKIVGNRDISLSELKVERNLISGTSYYNVNIGNNKYLHGSGNANISAENEASAKNSASFELVNKSLTLKINNFVLKFNNAADQMRFRFYSGTSTMKNVTLYKLVTTDSINNEVNNYASTFSTKINAICDINGVNTNVDRLNTAWGELASSFKGLSVDAQGIIASVSYTRNGEKSGSKEYVADKYDYIFSKYSDKLTDGDFMTRQGLSVYQPSVVRTSFFELNMNSDSSISVIVLIAIISISSIGGYLVIKRRKEN